MSDVETITGETCPLCFQKTLTLMERAQDIPHFGVVHIFGMQCENPDCDYGLSDLEREEEHKAVKDEIEISSEEQLGWYVIKSASATIKIPRMVEITPGPDADGFITTVEGVLHKFKAILEELKQDDDKTVAKKAKNQLKKLQKVLWGQETIKLQLSDPTGNSGFVRERLELLDE